MLRAFPGFHVIELRASTGACCFWRARDAQTGREVLLKSRRMGSPEHKRHALALEERRLRAVDSPLVIKVQEAQLDAPDPFLVLENLPEHEALNELVDDGALASANVIELAIHLTLGLASVHESGVCCLSLQPEVVWVDPNYSRTVLMDLSNSAQLGHFAPDVVGCYELQGALSYIAPEQSGRSYQALDQRSDFYTLGLILHFALRGSYAFSHHRTPHSLIYAQLCEQPPALPTHGVAPALRGIVAKLCQKSKRHRYQSLHGLLYDLQKTRKEIAFNRHLDFPAGQQDRPQAFTPSPALYERDEAIGALRNAIERCARGESSYVSIEGAYGSGKSTLLRSIMPDLARHQMLFARGRCHEGLQGQNYGPITEIIRALISAAHALPPNLRREQKQRTGRALKGRASALIPFIPELESFIGKSNEPLGVISDREKHRACHEAMFRVLLSFACHHQPLVLHFDNLQWAEYSTTSMIQALLADPQSRYLLIIGCTRHDEELTPLSKWAESLIKSSVPYESIHLGNLSRDACVEYICDSLSSHSSVTQLAHWIYEQTRGAPDAIAEMLLLLHERGAFEYDEHARAWRAHTDKLQLPGASVEQASILERRLEELDPELAHILTVCAMLGNSPRCDRLACALGIPSEEARKGLYELAELGFLHLSLRPWRANLSTGESHRSMVEYHFAKSQTREHLLRRRGLDLELRHQLCQRLLDSPSIEHSDAIRRSLVRLASPAIDSFIGHPSAKKLMGLLAQEAHRAFACTAFDRAEMLAQGFLKLASPLLEADDDAIWNISIKRATAAQVCGNDLAFEQRVEALETICNNTAREVELLHTKIVRAIDNANPQIALNHLFTLSRALGLPIEAKPSSFVTSARVARWHLQLTPKRIEQLLAGPALRDPDTLKFLDAMWLCTSAAFTTNQPNLYIAIVSKVLEITFDRGISSASAVFIAHVGMMYLCRSRDRVKADRAFSWAYRILKHLPHRHYHASVVFIDALYRAHRRHGLQGGRTELVRTHELAVEAGDEWTASHANAISVAYSLWNGDPLDAVSERLLAALRYAHQSQADNAAQILEGVQHNIARIQDTRIPARSVNSFATEGQNSDSSDAMSLAHDIFFAVHAQDYELAWQHARRLDCRLPLIEGLVTEVLVAFYRAIAACFFLNVPDRRPRAMSDIEDGRQRLGSWREQHPQSFAIYESILDAIYQAELLSEHPDSGREGLSNALRMLDHCIAEAESLQQYHLAALAATWGARWSTELGRAGRIRLYENRFKEFRRKWGAIQSADQAQPLVPWSRKIRRSESRLTSETVLNPRGLDRPYASEAHELLLQSCSIMTRSHAMQEGIRDFLGLASKVFRANRLVLLLDAGIDIGQGEVFPGSKGLLEVARMESGTQGKRFSFEQSELSSQRVPTSLIYRARNHKETILIECVRESSLSTKDSYLRTRKPYSVLVAPMNEDRVGLGVIYIECLDKTDSLGAHDLMGAELLSRVLGTWLINNNDRREQIEKAETLARNNSDLEARLSKALRESRALLSSLDASRKELQAHHAELKHALTCGLAGPDDARMLRVTAQMEAAIKGLGASEFGGREGEKQGNSAFPMQGLLDRLCARAQVLAKRHNSPLSIRSELDEHSLTVFGDKARYLSALELLLIFSFDQAKGQTLALSVSVHAEGAGANPRWISDLIIPCRAESPQARIQLFELVQVTPDKEQRELFAARQGISALGGHMEIEPLDGAFRLRVSLPMERYEEGLEHRNLRLMPNYSMPRGREALIVEDDPEAAEQLKTLLSQQGIETRIATNGLEAVQSFQSQPLSFGLIIMNCSLPVMDGYQAAAHIRACMSVRAPYLIILGMSKEPRTADLDRCRASGMDGLLAKPIGVQELAQSLAHWGWPEHEQSQAQVLDWREPAA